MRIVLWFICAVALTACAHQPAVDRAARFQAEIDHIREQYGFPGMTAAYVLRDGTSGTAASGLAEVEAQIPMTDNTRMLAASTGKSFVSALCIALALEGRLALDEPLSRWLGKYTWFKRLPNHESITLRHLLTHSAGLPDHVHMRAFEKSFSNEWQTSKNPFPPKRLVEYLLDKHALFPAGQGWAYSDTGYILVGMIIEEVTGHSYYDEVRKRFLHPLGLRDTSPADRRNLDRLAQGYMRSDNPFGLPGKTLDEHRHLYWHPGVEWTGGGLVSTSRDLAHWGAALFTGKAMTGDYLPELFRSVAIDPKNADIRYGAGIAIYTSDRFGPVYGHAGWIPGYISSFRYYRDSGVTIAFQINTDKGVIDSDKDVLRTIEERMMQVLVRENE
ncbi:MAG: serine hydrolase domain-containing protein [Acidiferrobacterales bacterium]